ncbi:MAG: ketopantoate reductase family protein [Anaerolineae bacterium]
MKIAVVGAGAMGSLFGGLLSKVADVTLVDPWQEHVEAINREGLRLTEVDGKELVIRVPATTSPTDVKGADLAIIFVKSYQTEMAAQMAVQLLAPHGLALTLQNGVGNREVLARVLGESHAWQGVTAHGATLLGPGRVRHAGSGPTHLELRPDIATAAQEVVQLFNQADLETHLSTDLDTLVWGKLVINVGINALTAILRVPNGILADIEPTRGLVEVVVREAVQVAHAKGIRLPYEDPVARVIEVAKATASNRSSMLQDVMRGSRTEIDVINGAIVREARTFGLQAPYNQALVALVQAIEATHAYRV